MKRTIAAILLLVLVLSSITALAEQFYPCQIAFCNEYVTLRARPSASSSEVRKVWIGEVVMASPYNSEFSYCCYDGDYGYIKTRYLSGDIQPWSEGRFYVTNCNEYISMREMPVKGSDVLARIPLGAQLDAVYYHDGGDNTFVYVEYNGKRGFAMWDYIAPVYLPWGQ